MSTSSTPTESAPPPYTFSSTPAQSDDEEVLHKRPASEESCEDWLMLSDKKQAECDDVSDKHVKVVIEKQKPPKATTSKREAMNMRELRARLEIFLVNEEQRTIMRMRILRRFLMPLVGITAILGLLLMAGMIFDLTSPNSEHAIFANKTAMFVTKVNELQAQNNAMLSKVNAIADAVYNNYVEKCGVDKMDFKATSAELEQEKEAEKELVKEPEVATAEFRNVAGQEGKKRDANGWNVRAMRHHVK